MRTPGFLVLLLAATACTGGGGGGGGGNQAPDIAGESLVTDEDTDAVVTVQAGDADGDELVLTVANPPAHGTATIAGMVLTYSPDANYHGGDTFTLSVTDGTDSVDAPFTMTVAPVNDAPTGADDEGTTAEDVPLILAMDALVANDADIDGDTLLVIGVQAITGGAVAASGADVVFTPDENFTGEASFGYTVSDGDAFDLVESIVTITVTPVNDAPVATNDAVMVAEDGTLEIAMATLLANDTDVDGPAATITLVSSATNGSVTLGGGMVTFTPSPDFSGAAGFTYTVSDGTLTDAGAVAVTVTAVNDAPIAVDDSGATDEDVPFVVSAASLVSNDMDIDDASLTVAAVANAVNGDVTLSMGTVTFTPSLHFHGFASFEYTVDDGDTTDTGSVMVVVNAVDDCGDTEPAPGEECDDGDLDDTDGCTRNCTEAVVCNAAAFPGGDAFSVDVRNGNCFPIFTEESTTFGGAYASCVGIGGHLATLTDSTEDAVVGTALAFVGGANPWIGASEDGNDTDAVFNWITGETFAFTHFQPGQPDDDAGFGGNGECLHIVNGAREWNDTDCNFVGFVNSRVCEVEMEPCGDGIEQPVLGETCDDGNTVSFDGCTSTCQDELPGFTVTPASGLVTSEAGGIASFTIVLRAAPSADVTIGIASNNELEGLPSQTGVTFTPGNWFTPRSITVTGQDDLLDDGNTAYSIVLSPDVVTSDPNYNGLDPIDVGCSNTDDD